MIPGRVVFLDLETTGADPRQDRITEVGLVVVDEGNLTEEWSTLVNPGHGIPPGIEALTGISDAMVECAPRFEAIALELASRLDGRLLVAHNARFDCAFLRNEFRRAGLPFEPRVLCSVRLSRRLFPEQRRHNLDALIERFALPPEVRHRALPDARLVYFFARVLGRLFDAPTLDAAIESIATAPSLPPWLAGGVADDLPDLPGVYILYDSHGQPLYAGRAGNLRTQVLAHFSARGKASREQRAALQAGSIEWIPTAGELGAALRHLRLVEALAPRHNRRPRAAREAWGLRWQPQSDEAVVAVDLDAVDETAIAELFGPFRSRADAWSALRGLTREHGLCPNLVGLEPGGGPCSQHPKGACRGACTGGETRAAHAMRLVRALLRLRMAPWPLAPVAGLLEADAAGTRSELHVLRAWRYVGSARSPAELPELLDRARTPAPFDVDAYRLLQRALQERRCRPVDLSHALPSWPG